MREKVRVRTGRKVNSGDCFCSQQLEHETCNIKRISGHARARRLFGWSSENVRTDEIWR